MKEKTKQKHEDSLKEKEGAIKITSYSATLKLGLNKVFKFIKYVFILIFFFGIACFLIAFFGTLGLYLKYQNDFQGKEPQNNSSQLIMYDKNGQEIFREYGAAEPVRVELKNIPKVVRNATLAAEDVSFYNHGPISFKSLGRAIYLNWESSNGNIFDKISGLTTEGSYTQGGSTITQQLVKNIYLTSEKSFERKMKEAVFSYKLEEKYSKDKILEIYLNEIYYGEQALGISNASKIYFNKDVKDLDLAEASMLAGLPQAPSYYNPLGDNYGKAKIRQEYVLQQMYAAKMITFEEAKAAANEELTFYGKIDTVNKYPFYSQYVISELNQKLGSENVKNSGYKIYTTLDPVIQASAEARVSENLIKLAYRGASNAAVVVANPKDNTILGMVGGADWNSSNVNVATSLRQPGSSFKPIVYAAGLENGYTAATILIDKSVNFGGTPAYKPQNYSGGYSGYLTARNALARSLNIPAVEMGKLAGVDKILATAKTLGITSLDKSVDEYGLSIALGSGEVKLVDMVAAYSTFADAGKRGPQTTVTKILDNSGVEIPLPKPNKKEVFSPQTSYIISSMLSDNNARSVTFGSNSPLRTEKTTAVKTGTTDNYSDSWTMGYSPDIVVGVWMGNNDHTPMKNVSGIEGAAYIWHDIITDALSTKPDTAFPKPSGLTEAWINPSTGGTVNSKYSPNILEYFKDGTVPGSKIDLTYLKQF
ncbi:MAG: PBP1A family penicillin-binding protein [bacterium]